MHLNVENLSNSVTTFSDEIIETFNEKSLVYGVKVNEAVIVAVYTVFGLEILPLTTGSVVDPKFLQTTLNFGNTFTTVGQKNDRTPEDQTRYAAERTDRLTRFIERAREIKECLGVRVMQLIDNHDRYF